MSADPLRMSGVSQCFGDVVVLDSFDLVVHQGEFLAVVGPSGCGKTTLLNVLSGFHEPASGSVRRAQATRTIYQHGGLFPWLTVTENIALGLGEPDPAARSAAIQELLELIGLTRFAEHYPHQLSGGMRQRVELARAVAGETDVLLMDEPFSALDYQTRLRMRRELVRLLQQRPRTVVFVTHDIEEAAQLADRVLVLSDRPARVRCELRLSAPRPRAVTHPEVVAAVERILDELGLEQEGSRPDPELAGAEQPVLASV